MTPMKFSKGIEALKQRLRRFSAELTPGFAAKAWKGAGALLALAFILALAAPSAHGAQAQSGILRLHILANSDSPADQQVKLKVRDALIKALPACNSAAEAEAYIKAHGKEVLALAEKTLAENGFSYGAQLLLGDCDFPKRTYGGVTYPAGEYRALRVVLGNGAGQNWWCVLFPPLCIITTQEEPLPSPEELEFESSILSWIQSFGEEAPS